MPEPFVFIATNRLRSGSIDTVRQNTPELCAFVEATEPQIWAFNQYVNEAGTEVGVVQVHPDADSMELHLNVIRDRAASAYAETIEATSRIQVFGMPSPAILEMLRQQAGSGVPIDIKPQWLGGFSRHR